MTDKQLEQKILEKIKIKRTFPFTFHELTDAFEDKFSKFNPTANCFDIADYFSEGSGQVSARRQLLADNKIEADWLREYETKKGNTKIDFSGLYVFINEKTPFYVGISKGVIGRIFQHIKGHNHNTSTLAYNIGLIRYELLTGEKHLGERKELNFKTEVEPVKQFLLKQKIAFLHIDNYEELALFEIFCSMNLKTILNKFETH
jgi:predicted GIY-YIG superfamily endonuclease